MEKGRTKFMQACLVIVAMLAWLGLVIQFYVIITNRTAPIPETIVRYFSYFTILSNILVALNFTYVLLKPHSRLGHYFSRPSVAAAITFYITIVGIIYNTVLRQLWSPRGLAMVADELTHLIVPLLVLLCWLIFAPKGKLQWKDSFPWLIYPLAYFSWALVFGALSEFYPYYFINVNELGYGKVLLTSGILVIGFFLLSLFFIGIDKLMKPKLSITSRGRD